MPYRWLGGWCWCAVGLTAADTGSLPSTVKAIRIQDKARGVGFDRDIREQVWEKVHEELGELKHEVDNNTPEQAEELGDVLFALVNYARFLNIDPDEALERKNRKYIQRFQFLERESHKDGKVMGEMTLDEMEGYWQRAKWECRVPCPIRSCSEGRKW